MEIEDSQNCEKFASILLKSHSYFVQDPNYHCPSSWLRKAVVSVPTFMVIYLRVLCVCAYAYSYVCIHVPIGMYGYIVQKEMIHLVLCMQSVRLKT